MSAEVAEQEQRPVFFQAPEGSKVVELRPDRGYLIQFERPISPAEMQNMMALFAQFSQGGYSGPFVIIPAGFDVAEMVHRTYPPLTEPQQEGQR